MLYDALPVAVAASALLASLLVLVQQATAGARATLVWLALFVVVSLWRLLMLRAWRRDDSTPLRAERRYIQGAAAAGLVWGLASVLLFPSSTPHQVFLAFVVAGVSAGGVSTLAASLPAAASFLASALLPLTLRLALVGGLMATSMAIMTLAFLGFLVLAARRIAQTLEQNSVLRFQEEQQQSSQVRQTELLERMGEIGRIGIWQLDVATGAVRWSTQLYRIYGLADGPPPPMEVALTVLPEPGRSDLDRAIRRVIEQGVPYEGEYELVNLEGRTLWIHVAFEPELEGGTVVRVHGIVQDVTERRRLDVMKSEFVSTASHELRTPLTSIRGSLGLVASGAAGTLPERARNLLEIAARNSERLILLINDLLDIEKIESRQMAFTIRRQPLLPLVQQALDATSEFASSLGVSYELRGESTALVDVDGERFVQVLVNLLSNAAKFSPPGGSVTVSVSDEAASSCVSVRDRGPGIPESFIPRLFQKFSQADSSDRRRKGGTGLGLAIARAIMERLGGTIELETAEGQGSTFRVRLPRGA